MKKHLLIIIIILVIIFTLIFTYSFKEKNIVENPQPTIQDEEVPEIENIPEYIDDNPIKLGLYKNYRNGSNRKLITEYTASWEYHTDISSFEVYYTQEGEISSGNQIKTFDLYKNNYDNINDYRIGYIIEFEINDININKTIISPKDTEEFYDYLEIYLYDDYHRAGGWYSHTTEEEFNENTLLTSIKLTAGKKITEITSDITVTAFTYDNDDFDEQGSYKGISKYQIIVKNS